MKLRYLVEVDADYGIRETDERVMAELARANYTRVQVTRVRLSGVAPCRVCQNEIPGQIGSICTHTA